MPLHREVIASHPGVGGERWYIKAYLVAEDPDNDPDGTNIAVFISVHKTVRGFKGLEGVRR